MSRGQNCQHGNGIWFGSASGGFNARVGDALSARTRGKNSVNVRPGEMEEMHTTMSILTYRLRI